MQTWTKTTRDGKLVELHVSSRTIKVMIDGKPRGTAGDVVRLTDALRRDLYRHCPKVTSAGEPITHVVGAIPLTEPEGTRIAAMLAEETRLEDERRMAAEFEKHADKFATAAATGKPVEVDRGMDECSDPAVECNQVAIIRWANPDGTFSVTRQHTY